MLSGSRLVSSCALLLVLAAVRLAAAPKGIPDTLEFFEQNSRNRGHRSWMVLGGADVGNGSLGMAMAADLSQVAAFRVCHTGS